MFENSPKTPEMRHQSVPTSSRGHLEQHSIFKKKMAQIARYRPFKMARIGGFHYKWDLKPPKKGRKHKYTKLIPHVSFGANFDFWSKILIFSLGDPSDPRFPAEKPAKGYA